MLKNIKINFYDVYFKIIILAVCLSSIVFIEPAPTDILIMLAFMWGILRFFQNYSQYTLPALLLFIFITTNILSSFALVDIQRGIFHLFTKIYLVFSWWLFTEFTIKFGSRGLKHIFTGYTLASIIAAILGLAGFFNLISLNFANLVRLGRPQALFKDPNVFGPFLVPVALYAVLNIESSKGIDRLYWLFVLLVTSLGILFSFSRAAWLNYAVSLFIYIVLRFIEFPLTKTSVSRIVLYGILILIIIFMFISIIKSQPEIADFFNQRFALQGYDEDRFGTQRNAFDDFINNPISLGIGPGQFEALYPISSHSTYVRLCIENSLLGVFSFFGFIVLTLKRSIRYAIKPNYEYKGLFILFTSTIIGILINSLVIDTIHWRHFWLLLALPWGNYSKKIN